MTRLIPYIWLVAAAGLFFSGALPYGAAVNGIIALSTLPTIVFILIMHAVENSLRVEGYRSGDWPIQDEAAKRVEQFEKLGFEKLDTLRLDSANSPTVVALSHPEHKLYATVFTLSGPQSLTSYDIISVDPDKWIGLTTGPMDDGCSMPAAVGQFRQAFEGAEPEELLEKHLEGLESLKKEGFKFDFADMSFTEFFRAGMFMSANKFHKSPLTCTAIALYRTVTRDHPHKGSLGKQKIFAKQLKLVKNTDRRVRYSGRG